MEEKVEVGVRNEELTVEGGHVFVCASTGLGAPSDLGVSALGFSACFSC